jgi:crossover junction endodeoxyribonuclease RusA
MVRSTLALAYRDMVQELATEAGLEPYACCVQVEMVLHPVRPKDWAKREMRDRNWVLGVRRIDIDNAQKVAIDALQGVAYENDRQITSLSICLGSALENGGLSVCVTPDLTWG